MQLTSSRITSAICVSTEIDPFHFFVVEATARCLYLLWERPIGAAGDVVYMVTVEDAADYRRQLYTEAINLEVCGLKELTDYMVSINATSNVTVTDTTVVTHATTAGVCV